MAEKLVDMLDGEKWKLESSVRVPKKVAPLVLDVALPRPKVRGPSKPMTEEQRERQRQLAMEKRKAEKKQRKLEGERFDRAFVSLPAPLALLPRPSLAPACSSRVSRCS